MTAAIQRMSRVLDNTFGAMFGDLRRLWHVTVPLLAIWILALVRLFGDPIPRVPLLFNWTPSLPCHIAWLKRSAREPRRGDYVLFSFHGEAQDIYRGLRGQPFFKIIRGVPGDSIVVNGRVVTVNGEVVGTAKTHAFDRRPLEPIATTVIPAGHYYVQGTSPDSFDSRYRSSGLITADQLIGTVLPLL